MLLLVRIIFLGSDRWTWFSRRGAAAPSMATDAASGDMRKALGVCRSAVKVFESKLQDSSDQEFGVLNKSYIEICRSAQVPGIGMLEFSNVCMILIDQGYLKLGHSKD